MKENARHNSRSRHREPTETTQIRHELLALREKIDWLLENHFPDETLLRNTLCKDPRQEPFEEHSEIADIPMLELSEEEARELRGAVSRKRLERWTESQADLSRPQ